VDAAVYDDLGRAGIFLQFLPNQSDGIPNASLVERFMLLALPKRPPSCHTRLAIVNNSPRSGTSTISGLAYIVENHIVRRVSPCLWLAFVNVINALGQKGSSVADTPKPKEAAVNSPCPAHNRFEPFKKIIHELYMVTRKILSGKGDEYYGTSIRVYRVVNSIQPMAPLETATLTILNNNQYKRQFKQSNVRAGGTCIKRISSVS
jgi:hypothetical protein